MLQKSCTALTFWCHQSALGAESGNTIHPAQSGVTFCKAYEAAHLYTAHIVLISWKLQMTLVFCQSLFHQNVAIPCEKTLTVNIITFESG